MAEWQRAERYLGIAAAWPLDVDPRGEAYVIASDCSGTAQVYRLDRALASAAPIEPGEMAQITACAEPVTAVCVPAGESGKTWLLLSTDAGGNERHQLFLAAAEPAAPIAACHEAEGVWPVAVDERFIHRLGGIDRSGALLAFASNRRDGVAFDAWVRDLEAGRDELAFTSGGWIEPAGFSPDGSRLALIEQTVRAGDNRLYILDRERARERAREHGPQAPASPESGHVVEIAPHEERSGSVGAPSWLPRGDAFFFATNVGREFTGIARGEPSGAWAYVVEPGWDCQCGTDWAGRHVLVCRNEDGYSRLELRDPQAIESVHPVPLPGDGVATGFRFSPDGGELLFAFSAPDRPWEAWRYRPESEELDALTKSPCEVERGRFAPAEAVRFPAHDGLSIPAFLIRPRRGQRPAPVVALVHGGPEAQWRPSFSPWAQLLADEGFAVLAPNVRGSTGYGRSYQHADDRELRWDAIRDLEAVHDFIRRDPDLDEGRAVLYGGSYGGYMTLAGLAFQPERWAAGVDVVGMSNLVTFLENTSPWRRPYREREYGSLDRDRELLEALSPLGRAGAMRAPLCVIHGENDPRVPLGETEQLHRALRGGGVRCDLRVYPDEGHGLAKRANRVDAYGAILRFLREEIRP